MTWTKLAVSRVGTRVEAGESMRIAALTMVYRDHWFLQLWTKHYGDRIGPANLFVVSHGDEPEIRDICAGCQVIPYARDDLELFDQRRWTFLSDLCEELLQKYDAVIVGDVDEYLIPLNQASTLETVLAEHADRAFAFVAGFDLLEHPVDDAPMRPDVSVFKQRKLGKWSGRYSKAVVAYEPVRFRPGAHRVRGRDTTRYCVLSGAVLAHLKYSNSALWADKSAIENAIVTSREKDFRWDNQWRRPIAEGDPALGFSDAYVEAFEASFAAFFEAISIPEVGRGSAVGHQRIAHQPFFLLPRSFESYL